MRYLLNLQLFATSKTNSSSSSKSQTQHQENTQSASHTEGGSSTSSSSTTVGGSHSVSNGWAESDSVGQSLSQSQSQGGQHSDSTGKSWASGQVDANTQAQRDKYNTDYQQGQKAQDAYDRLQNTLDQKPTFQSQYENKLNDLYNSIMNRDKFSYDFNADQMYQMYKDKYTTAGKRAMEDTMAQNAALSGGYGSSYAQTAGQQTYQNYLQQLNDMLPTLRNQAYQEYQDEGNRMLQQYNLTNDAYNREYGQYRDSVSDWQSDRGFDQSMYQDERNFDYNQFNNERNFWNQEYWNERNAEQSNMSSADSTNWNKGTTQTDSREHSSQKNGSVTDTSSWSKTDSVSNTSSWQDSVSNSTTNSLTNQWSNSSNSSTTVNDSGSGTGNSSIASLLGYNEAPQYDSRGFLLNSPYTTNDKNNTYYNSGNVQSSPSYDANGFKTNNNVKSSNANEGLYDGLSQNSSIRSIPEKNLEQYVEMFAYNPQYTEEMLRRDFGNISTNDINWFKKVSSTWR